MNIHAIRTWWGLQRPRDQAFVGISVLLCLLAFAWLLALSPALKKLHHHEDRMRQLQATLSEMRAMEAQAKTFQGQGSLDLTQAQQKLRIQTIALLGKKADLSLRNGGASVTLRFVPPHSLGRWLAAIRTEAHARVTQAKLHRTPDGWSGSIQLTLPE